MNRPDTRGFKRRTTASEVSKIEQVSKAMASPVQSPPLGPAIPKQGLAPAQALPVTGLRTSYLDIPIGTTLEIPPEIAKTNPYDARHVRSQASIDELAMKIKAETQLVAAAAFVDADGGITLIDGFCRREACKIAGVLFRIEIRPTPKSNKELYRQSRSANKYRNDQTPLDDALAWRKLLEDRVYDTQAELCREEDLDTTTVNRTLGLADMPKMIITMLADRPEMMNLRMLDAINRYYKAAFEANPDVALNMTESLVLNIEKSALSSRDIDRLRVTLQRGPVSRKRSILLTNTYERGESTMKRFAGQGRLQLDITKIDDEERVALLERRINEVIVEVLGSKK